RQTELHAPRKLQQRSRLCDDERYDLRGAPFDRIQEQAHPLAAFGLKHPWPGACIEGSAGSAKCRFDIGATRYRSASDHPLVCRIDDRVDFTRRYPATINVERPALHEIRHARRISSASLLAE